MFHRFSNDNQPNPVANSVVPAPCELHHPFDDIARHDQVDFETARLRHVQLLEAINQDVARQTSGGALIAAPLCPSACIPGDLADFLLMLHCDPFGPTNMRYAADTPETAEMLETDEYTPELAMRFDAELQGFYKRARAAWDDFKIISPDATRIDVLNHRDTLRALVAQAAERLDERDDTPRRHLWRRFVAANSQQAA